MKNLEMEIEKYVKSKQSLWSDRTVHTVRPKLRTMASDFFDPIKNHKKLLREGYGKYTIKTYFTIASKFEEEVYGSNLYRNFLTEYRSTFKNCYQNKTRNLKTEDFEKFLNMYIESNYNMYNLLILMGTAGLRISEALNVKWEDFKDGMLWVVGKGGKQRAVPFDLKTLIRPTIDSIGKVIGTLSYRFLFERDLKPFTPHDFRAHYATFVANHPELSINDAALLLGHSHITTTSRYVRTDINRIAKVLKRKA